MYTRLSKAFYFLTILLFLIVFMYIYAASPEFVSYEVNEMGMPLKQMSRDAFFYIIITVFLVSNVLLVLPAKMIEVQYTYSLKRLFPIGDWFRDQILAWTFTFIGGINISISISVFYMHSISNQNEMNSSNFNFIFYLVPVFFVVWILLLFFILNKKLKQVRSTSL